MRLGFLRLLRGLDDYGHPIKVTYRGEETYQTLCGSLFSLIVLGFTMAIGISALIEVFSMEEPTITQYLKPLQDSHRAEIGKVNFADYGYNVGVRLEWITPKLDPFSNPFVSHPWDFVQLKAWNIKVDEGKVEIPLVDCMEVIPENEIQASNGDVQKLLKTGEVMCLDLESSSLSLYKDDISNTDRDQIYITLDTCPNSQSSSDSSCKGLFEWLNEFSLLISVVETRTRVDYRANSDYFVKDVILVSDEELKIDKGT